MEWQRCAEAYMKVRYPISVLRGSGDLLLSINTILGNWADRLEAPVPATFKVYVVNCTFLGFHFYSKRNEITAAIAAKLSDDPERSCALWIAPNAGPYKQTFDRPACEKGVAELLDHLRDEAYAMKVEVCQVMWDPTTMWSSTRKLQQPLFMAVSDKRSGSPDVNMADADPNAPASDTVDRENASALRSFFRKSQLWIRGGTSEVASVLPRGAMVDPTARVMTSEKGNYSAGQEYKQWATGVSFYGKIAESLWVGMKLTSKDGAMWIDAVPYDNNLISTIMSRTGSGLTDAPREAVGSLLWAFPAAHLKLIEDFLRRRAYADLLNKCESKAYLLANAPDISNTEYLGDARVRIQPTYDESRFKVTKPLADQTLPIRQDTYQKWLSSNIPVFLQDEFKAACIKHNAKHNASGKTWSPAAKRSAASSAEGSEAAQAAPDSSTPQSIDELKKKHGDENVQVKTWGAWTHIAATDGSYYLLANEDDVADANKPLGSFIGEYLIGNSYESAIKDGGELFEWQMASPDYEAFFTTEPVFKEAFTSNVAKLSDFLHYLAENGKVDVRIECHKHKRVRPQQDKDLATFEISASEKCGFRPKGSNNPKVQNMLTNITPTGLKESKYLKFVMRMKYVQEHAAIEPGRPALCLKKSLKFRKGVLLKLA